MYLQTTGKNRRTINLCPLLARYGWLSFLAVWAIGCAKPIQHDENMKTIVNGFHKVKLTVLNIGSGEESSFAINELIQPHAPPGC